MLRMLATKADMTRRLRNNAGDVLSSCVERARYASLCPSHIMLEPALCNWCTRWLRCHITRRIHCFAIYTRIIAYDTGFIKRGSQVGHVKMLVLGI